MLTFTTYSYTICSGWQCEVTMFMGDPTVTGSIFAERYCMGDRDRL